MDDHRITDLGDLDFNGDIGVLLTAIESDLAAERAMDEYHALPLHTRKALHQAWSAADWPTYERLMRETGIWQPHLTKERFDELAG